MLGWAKGFEPTTWNDGQAGISQIIWTRPSPSRTSDPVGATWMQGRTIEQHGNAAMWHSANVMHDFVEI